MEDNDYSGWSQITNKLRSFPEDRIFAIEDLYPIKLETSRKFQNLITTTWKTEKTSCKVAI